MKDTSFLYRGIQNAYKTNKQDFFIAAYADNGDWYDAVDWPVAEGITAGTIPNTFSPDAVCTRAQIVALMYRIH